jgi:hypothetical protein
MVRRVTSGRWGTAVLAAALGLAGAGVAPAVATVDPVEVVVTAGTLDAAARAVDASGGVVTTPLEFLGGVAATLPSTAVAALQARPGITVTPDEVVEVAATDTATDLGARLGPTDVAGQDQLAALSLPDHWSPASGRASGSHSSTPASPTCPSSRVASSAAPTSAVTATASTTTATGRSWPG